MIEIKPKKCKGTGKALGHGCGEKALKRIYGLCMNCYPKWLYSTEEGQKVVKRRTISSKKNTEKEERRSWNEKKKSLRHVTHPGEMKKELALEAQKLARMIDKRFGFITCIDCGNPFNDIIDGGHFHSKGNNASLMYNLHNIHSQRRHCNGFAGGKQRGYYDGLVQRYGKEYADLVDVGLQKKYKYIGMMNAELPEKLKIIRAIIRTFDSYKLENPIQARELFNKIIGIYT